MHGMHDPSGMGPPPPGPPQPGIDPATGQQFDFNTMMMMGMVNNKMSILKLFLI